VNHNIISPKDAAAHLEALYESNIRLPNEEVVKRLEQWK
jgi:predicted polyphosphate/ATP-dependent NAD kinase